MIDHVGARSGERGAESDVLWLVAVGSNLGDRAAQHDAAADALTASGLATVVARGGAIDTDPVGGPADQGTYRNDVWLVASDLGPHQLLALLLRIEDALGRTRVVRWGARTIDLDLLARLDGLTVESPVLTLPHPRMADRPFVIEPLRRLCAVTPHPALLAWSSRHDVSALITCSC
jgi:dihydroneopterin aldolase/2-amino-4-hydroxy-6-hydroxymethyldihydropteridine diphosphokinase